MSTNHTPENVAALGDVFQRKTADDRYIRPLWRAERGAQSAEMNDLAHTIDLRLRALGNAVFNDGKVIIGAQPTLNGGTTTIAIESGQVYFKGHVWSVPAQSMVIPWNAKVSVGIQYREMIVTEEDDATLRDPAPYSVNAGQPGAARIRADFVWGWQADNATSDGKTNPPWEFFPIYTVDDGVLVVDTPTGIADPVVDLIAKYDREAHGNYVVDGLIAAFLSETNDDITISVGAGLANIQGYKLQRRSDERFTFEKDFDERFVDNEFHEYHDDGSGSFQLWFSNSPVSRIGDIIGQKQATDGAINRGSIGGSDLIHPSRSIASIVSVRFNDVSNALPGMTHDGTWVTFTQGVDYTRSGNNINWSPVGYEVPSGSTYEITYRYSQVVTPDVIAADHVVISGLVEGSTIVVDDYDYKLPRVDLLVMNRDGFLERINGVPQLRNPAPPKAAENQIAICEIALDWVNAPVVRNVSVRSIKFDELKSFGERIEDLYDLQAQNELRFNTVLEDPTSKLNVFVDSFVDDDMRDAGITQTAAIVDGVLTLAIDATLSVTNDTVTLAKFITLPFVHRVLIEQNRKTGSMNINPYQAYEPMPALLTLEPPIDVWTEFATEYTSPVTAYFWKGTQDRRPHSGPGKKRTVTEVKTKFSVIGRESRVAQFCRQRSVDFKIEGFGPNETLTALTFDSVNVLPA